MKQNKKLAEDLLIETALFYNSENRSMLGGECMYENHNGKRCGVGRIMNKKFIYILKKYEMNDSCVSTLADNCDDFGPEAFLKRWAPLSSHISFLEHIQDLHDVESRWDYNGITKKGLEFVEFMCDVYELNKDRVLTAIKTK